MASTQLNVPGGWSAEPNQQENQNIRLGNYGYRTEVPASQNSRLSNYSYRTEQNAPENQNSRLGGYRTEQNAPENQNSRLGGYRTEQNPPENQNIRLGGYRTEQNAAENQNIPLSGYRTEHSAPKNQSIRIINYGAKQNVSKNQNIRIGNSGYRAKNESVSETYPHTSLHFHDTEISLPTAGSTYGQSAQARVSEKIWDESVIYFEPLYRAALMGEWEVAEAFFNQDSAAITARITLLKETALHVAVGAANKLDFVEKLVNLMCERSITLGLQDSYGNTALAVAAIVGNVKDAQILVRKDEKLTLVKNKVNYSPLLLAAKYGHRDMILHLLPVTKDEGVFTAKPGARLLNFLITFDFYDIALDILNRQSHLAVEKDQYEFSALQMLAEKPDVFESGSQLGFWRRLLHRCVVVEEVADALLPMQHEDVENPPQISNDADFVAQELDDPLPMQDGDFENPSQISNNATDFVAREFDDPLLMQEGDVENPPQISNNADIVAEEVLYAPLQTQQGDQNPPQISNAAARSFFIKKVYDRKRKRMEACKLVKRLCELALYIGGDECASIFSTSILSAARMGTLEVATEILRVYPYAIWFRDPDERNIFQLAVLHRREKIYNLIYQMTSHKHFAIAFLDINNNNILHLAGELAPSDKISGAALQLQRELQWFKEVERLVHPSYKSMKNKEDKTPRMIFSKKHEELVRQGEKWMKITATSSSVVAALIATVAFTAIFTVPGGNNSDQGIPILLRDKSFMAFAITDALALITSCASVMMFLGILTSRYAEDDFLKVLPRRMIIGLVSLFISISSMVATFSASLYLVLVHQVKLVWIPVIVFALIPIMFFAMLQFPLVVQMISSTCGRSIFGLQSKEIIH